MLCKGGRAVQGPGTRGAAEARQNQAGSWGEGGDLAGLGINRRATWYARVAPRSLVEAETDVGNKAQDGLNRVPSSKSPRTLFSWVLQPSVPLVSLHGQGVRDGLGGRSRILQCRQEPGPGLDGAGWLWA